MGKKFTLLDDGTLDTVFLCMDCGSELRYSEVERDEHGDIPYCEVARLARDHAIEECTRDERGRFAKAIQG